MKSHNSGILTTTFVVYDCFYPLFPFTLKILMWFKYGLKAQKFQKQHALKGQKLLAQGIALGTMAINKAPCKGKSLINC